LQNYESNPLVSSLGTSSHVDSIYDTDTFPRGLVAVFNYTFKNSVRGEPRHGAECDSSNIKRTFGNLGYEVIILEDKTKQETFSNLDNIIQHRLNGMSCFILFFLSHGQNDKEFYAADEEIIEISSIYSRLVDSNCVAMKGKPKIMFLNYCRGESTESSRIMFDDFRSQIEAPRDLAIIHSTLPGIKAPRTSSGTIFIESLCEVLDCYGQKEELKGIVKFVDELARTKHGTTAEIRLIAFYKKFFFTQQ